MSLRIAYLIGRYPATSHSFIAREVAALRERGVVIETFSIWAADLRDLPSEQDRQEVRRTYAILPLRIWPAARAHLRGWRAAPGAYVRTLVRALRLGRPGIRGRFLGASWFVEAIIIWDALRRTQIRHVHVHLNGTAPSVALVLTTFGNQLDGDGAWSWSMTVHGSAEFYDVPGERLADKVRSARLVVCVSDFTRSQLMAQVAERHWDKLRVIRCGVDPDEFAPHRADAVGGDFALVTVARLTQGKGHGVLLEALRQLRDRGLAVRLILVGDGPKRSELEALARELGVESMITFVGAVGREDVHEYYRAADAFCLPSFHEGVPIVLMEAMALELPVVATDVMGIRELVENERNGLLVRPGRPDILADTLERLIADPDLGRRLGAAGRETVLQTFDIRRSAAEIHAAFEELLGVPSARPQAGRARERTVSS